MPHAQKEHSVSPGFPNLQDPEIDEFAVALRGAVGDDGYACTALYHASYAFKTVHAHTHLDVAAKFPGQAD